MGYWIAGQQSSQMSGEVESRERAARLRDVYGSRSPATYRRPADVCSCGRTADVWRLPE